MALTEPNRQQQRREKSTNALLDAAGELVLEGGFAKMTFAAIGTRAGFSRAMVTARFGNRQGLIEELLDRIITPWKERTYPQGHSNTGLRSIEVFVGSMIERTEANATDLRILHALMYEAIGGEEHLKTHIRDFHRKLRHDLTVVVARGQTDGSISAAIDPAAEVSLLVTMVRGVGYQWLLDPDEYDAVEAMRQAGEVSLSRLRAE